MERNVCWEVSDTPRRNPLPASRLGFSDARMSKDGNARNAGKIPKKSMSKSNIKRRKRHRRKIRIKRRSKNLLLCGTKGASA
jgi:hypothetical protein